MLEVLVLIEAGAGRREEHRVAGFGMFRRPAHRALHIAHRNDGRRALQRAGDAIRGGADGDHVACLLRNEIAHPLELTRFVFASQDQQHAGRGKTFQRFERGVDVRPFRVVDVTNAALLPHHHHPVRQPSERSERDLHRHVIDAHRARGKPCGQSVFHVRQPFQLQRRTRYAPLFAADAQDHLVAIQPGTFIHLLRCGEAPQASMGPPIDSTTFAGVHDCRVTGLLIAEDPILCCRVGVEVRIAVHVVGRNVQEKRDIRPERVNCLQLKRRKLQHVGPRLLLIDRCYQRFADVAGHDRLTAGDFEDLADQGRRRRLAVGAGDGDDRSFEMTERQLDLADDRNAHRRSVPEQRYVERNARADDDRLHSGEKRLVLLTEQPGHPFVQRIGKIGIRIAIVDGNVLAPLREEVCCSHARFARSHHE